MSLDTVCSTLAKLLTCDEARRIAANICEVAGAIARGMKKQMADVDLKFIAKQLERMTADIGMLRDDINVLSAIVGRLDGSVTALLQEMRATHAQISRMNERIR